MNSAITRAEARAPREAIAEVAGSVDGCVAALRLDGDGRISDATDDAAMMLGVTARDLLGFTLGDLADDQWRAMADSATARILCGDERTFQLLLRGRSGRRTLVQMAARRVREDGRSAYILSWSEHFSQPAAKTLGTEAEELRRLANGLVRAAEAERMRVSGELDEAIAPLIIVAKFMIEDARQRLGPTARADSLELMEAAGERLRSALSELQRMAAGLRPRMLDDLGLVPTIEWFCRGFEQKNGAIRIDRQVSVSEADVPEYLRLVIFRFIEEALANVATHSSASAAQVVLMRVSDELRLWVEDNGKGFYANDVERASWPLRGVGLAAVRKRIQATGGRMTLESSAKRGARVGATWPLAPRSATGREASA